MTTVILEGLAVGVVAGLIVEAVKKVKTLAAELRNSEHVIAAFVTQLELKFHTFDDIEVLYGQEVFKNKILPRDKETLERSLAQIMWLFDQIDNLHLLPPINPEGADVDSTTISQQVRQRTLTDLHVAVIDIVVDPSNTNLLISSLPEEKRSGFFAKFNKKGKEAENRSLAPANQSRNKSGNVLPKAWRSIKLSWVKSRLIKLVSDVRMWIDDLEKFTINVFPPILNELPIDELSTVKGLLASSIGVPPFRIALDILLTLAKPDYSAAARMEKPVESITFSNDAHEERNWVTYKGQEYLAVFKYGPVRNKIWQNQGALVMEVQGLVLALQDASKLQDLHILGCPGFFKQEDKLRYGLLFKPPQNTVKPTSALSLEEHLSSQVTTLGDSLYNRVQLATALANSMYQFHSIGWLHKSFRCNNVLLFEERDDPRSQPRVKWNAPYLLGFELSRKENQLSGHIITEDEMVWKVKLYQHPARLQENATPTFSKVHDIYSLGVLLLQLGGMATLTTPENEEKYKNFTPVNLRWEFSEMAERLVEKMGPNYSEVVQTCLKSEFGIKDDEPDSDRKLLSAFHDLVCKKLEGIQM